MKDSKHKVYIEKVEKNKASLEKKESIRTNTNLHQLKQQRLQKAEEENASKPWMRNLEIK